MFSRIVSAMLIVVLAQVASMPIGFDQSQPIPYQIIQPPPSISLLPTSVEENQARFEKFLYATQQMEKHIREQDGQLYLDVKNGLVIGVDETTFNQLRTMMEQTNIRLKNGQTASSNLQSGTTEYLPVRMDTVTNSCAGRTGIEETWYGYRVYLDSCKTSALVKLLTQGGAGTGLVCAALVAWLGGAPGPILCLMAAGLIIIGGGVIGAIHELGGNKGIVYVWTPVAGIQWIWHQ